MDENQLSNVPPLERPLGASEDDIKVGETELGEGIYLNKRTGNKYTLKRNPDQRTLRQKTTDALGNFMEDPKLPTAEQVKDTAVGAVTGAYNSLRAGMDGSGTYGDVLGVAPALGVAGAAVEVPEGALRMFGGLRAKTRDFKAAERAADLLDEGKSPEEVWKETGWAINSNNEWRFEIDDSEFDYSGAPHGKYIPLEAAVKHDKLFENYPELRDVLITEADLGEDHMGYMSFTTQGEPYIVLNSADPPEIRGDTLLHELQHIVQSIENDNFAMDYEVNRDYFGYRDQPEELEAEDVSRRRYFKPEARRNVKPKFNEGGLVMNTNMAGVQKSPAEMQSFADGGQVDPVSGNEVPPGSLPEEVRDDVDAKLSGGEYVVPADVVRYFGVGYFERLRKKAKEALVEMEGEGRIGGADPEEEDDELPFSDEELMTIDDEEEVEMAEGGLIPGVPSAPGFNPAAPGGGMESKTYVNDAGATTTVLFMNGQPLAPIPPGYRPQEQAAQPTGEQVAAPKQETRMSGGKEPKPEREGDGLGWAKDKNWGNMSPQEARQLAEDRLGVGTGFGATAAAGLGGVLGGPVVGGLVKGATALNSFSDANAIERALRATGNEVAANEVEKLVDERLGKAGFGIRNLEPMLASGVKKAERILGSVKAPTPNSVPDAPTSFSAKDKAVAGSTNKSGTRVSTKATPTKTADKAAASKTGQKGAPSRSNAVNTKAETARVNDKMANRDKTKQGFQEGGLVVRRKKLD